MGMTAFGVDVAALVAADNYAARDAWREREHITRDWQRLGCGQATSPPPRWAPQGVGSTTGGEGGEPIPPPAAADSAYPGVVDIYLSAGPREAVLACTNENVGNCSIWRIRMHLRTGSITDIERVVPSSSFIGGCIMPQGFIQPAVSPDGTRLAFVGICHEADGTKGMGTLWATDGIDHVAVDSGVGGNLPQYPNWCSDEWLLFNKTQGTNPQNWSSTLWWAHAWPDFNLVMPALGLNGFAHTGTGYEDAHTSANPAGSSTGLSRVVTFGGQNTVAPYDRVPRVSSATGEGEEVFGLPVGSGAGAFEECHHPAWHPRGDRILCTRQESPEMTNYGGGGLQAFRRLYASDWGGGAWGTPTPLVRKLTPEQFQRTSTMVWGTVIEDVFPTVAGGCWNYHWKFAEWCGHGRYVVAVLYCVDAALVTVHSRVMLIDLWEGEVGDGSTQRESDFGSWKAPSAYIDLVSYVEWHEAAAFGSWDGAWVTCTAALEV